MGGKCTRMPVRRRQLFPPSGRRQRAIPDRRHGCPSDHPEASSPAAPTGRARRPRVGKSAAVAGPAPPPPLKVAAVIPSTSGLRSDKPPRTRFDSGGSVNISGLLEAAPFPLTPQVTPGGLVHQLRIFRFQDVSRHAVVEKAAAHDMALVEDHRLAVRQEALPTAF